MDNPTWRQRLSYFTIFLPVRIYLLLFAAGILIAWLWVNTQHPGEQSAYGVVLALLLKVATWFIAIVLVLSFLSVFIPFLIFWWKVKRREVQVSLSNKQAVKRGQSLQRMQMSIEPVWQPPFGFLYYRFRYDESKLSPKFSIAPTRGPLKLFKKQKNGWYNWPLPTIREYEVSKLIVYFEDIFHFFSLSKSVRIDQSFFTRPQKVTTPDESVTPKKTEAEAVRIEELRKVQGEFLNYKNFEDNDDVRRIVWKIYAKNKELVVRTQEIFDPFASHTYFYCSYYDSLGIEDAPMMQTKGLNHFKNICWSVYEQLKKQGAEIKYMADQDIPAKNFGDNDAQAEYSVAVSQWQTKQPLNYFINPKNASVICISSLADVNSVEQVLEQAGSNTMLVFVKLTNPLRRKKITSWLNWIRWIFFQEEKEKDKTGMIAWRLSTARKKIRQNEKKLEALLKKTEARVITA